MATIAVGDVHGNYAALEDLLAKVVPELRAGDTLVFLGDVIDRGSRSREVVERIVELRDESAFSVVGLIGNHEQWMLKSLANPCAHSWLLGMGAFDTIASYCPSAVQRIREGLETAGMDLFEEKIPLPYELFFDAVPARHMEFFQGLKLYHRAPEVICVHGGMDLDGSLDGANPDTFIWGPEGFPEKYRGKHRVVYGHHNDAREDAGGWPRPAVNANGTYGIDSIAHGVLTAMRFPDSRVFQSARYREG